MRMIVMFFKFNGNVQSNVLDTQKIVTPKWYSEQCLSNVRESLKNLRLNKINFGPFIMILHQLTV